MSVDGLQWDLAGLLSAENSAAHSEKEKSVKKFKTRQIVVHKRVNVTDLVSVNGSGVVRVGVGEEGECALTTVCSRSASNAHLFIGALRCLPFSSSRTQERVNERNNLPLRQSSSHDGAARPSLRFSSFDTLSVTISHLCGPSRIIVAVNGHSPGWLTVQEKFSSIDLFRVQIIFLSRERERGKKRISRRLQSPEREIGRKREERKRGRKKAERVSVCPRGVMLLVIKKISRNQTGKPLVWACLLENRFGSLFAPSAKIAEQKARVRTIALYLVKRRLKKRERERASEEEEEESERSIETDQLRFGFVLVNDWRRLYWSVRRIHISHRNAARWKSVVAI